MPAVVKSILASAHPHALAGCTSMHDLIVVPTPIPQPPYDVVAVRAPGSIHQPPKGLVRIEHLSTTGHNDTIDKPTTDAIPLFWRFMTEKFGVHPTRS
ncbi:hypothetical protein GCM10009804_62320 [Kribbella hippodromi]|uniref:Uncharacterized protein n=1 Tax=Kribbella hippodromi TaxID=434347 RepID=A0ABN2E738_9ACTN